MDLDFGVTQLYMIFTLLYEGNSAAIIEHLKTMADINIINEKGERPIGVAISKGLLDVVKAMLKIPSLDLTLPCIVLWKEPYTPLFYAVSKGDYQNPLYTAIQDAILERDPNQVSWKDAEGNTILDRVAGDFLNASHWIARRANPFLPMRHGKSYRESAQGATQITAMMETGIRWGKLKITESLKTLVTYTIATHLDFIEQRQQLTHRDMGLKAQYI